MAATERSLGGTVLGCVGGCLLALLLALAGAHLYQPPNLMGASGNPLWLEGDFLCSLTSGLAALAVALIAARRVVRPRVFGTLLIHVLSWFGLTIFLFALWGQYLFLFTILVAPSQAFAVLRLVLLWQAWRAEVAWRRVG
jgi:hypothetical protein